MNGLTALLLLTLIGVIQVFYQHVTHKLLLQADSLIASMMQSQMEATSIAANSELMNLAANGTTIFATNHCQLCAKKEAVITYLLLIPLHQCVSLDRRIVT